MSHQRRATFRPSTLFADHRPQGNAAGDQHWRIVWVRADGSHQVILRGDVPGEAHTLVRRVLALVMPVDERPPLNAVGSAASRAGLGAPASSAAHSTTPA